MMKMFASFVLFCLALSCATAYEIVQDSEGQEFYLVPVAHRLRRQAPNAPIYKDKTHQVDGKVLNIGLKPISYGGQVNYKHIPSGSGVQVQAQHTRNFGTDVGVSGNTNVWRRGNSRIDAEGRYNRHFGGQQGTGRADSYGGLRFTHTF